MTSDKQVLGILLFVLYKSNLYYYHKSFNLTTLTKKKKKKDGVQM